MTICIGCVLTGIGGAFINNNAVSAMLNTELEEFTKVSGQDMAPEYKQRLQSSIASINTGAFAIGAILGPILSSMMVQFMSYQQAFMIVGLIVWILTIPHFYAQVFYKRTLSTVYKSFAA